MKKKTSFAILHFGCPEQDHINDRVTTIKIKEDVPLILIR